MQNNANLHQNLRKYTFLHELAENAQIKMFAKSLLIAKNCLK